ncbi:MAG: glucose 1-dehydrogenase [Acidobacteria bacterium]|nr:glucose 1-dehydrogenase [Acidobacteriota bacterium]
MPTLDSLFDLRGKTALITGGSRGLGAEMAEGLAEAGASLFLLARRAQWLEPTLAAFREQGFVCHGTLCDVSDADQVEAAVRAADEKLGRIDILVNNAGVTWGAPPEEMPLDKWRQVVDVNLTGTWLFSQCVGRRMLAQGGGSIVNVASIAGLVGSVGAEMSIPAYAASKAGVLGLTRELAARWGRRGIRVNAVAPGFFPSRMTEKLLERMQPQYEAQVPLGRVGRAGELKGVVVFLASEAASYITGQTIVVDGGATAV